MWHGKPTVISSVTKQKSGIVHYLLFMCIGIWKLSGLDYKPEITDIEGIAFNTNVEDKNSFTCSSDLLNSIQQATERTFLNNLISVQSDCPGREKFGYGGDLKCNLRIIHL